MDNEVLNLNVKDFFFPKTQSTATEEQLKTLCKQLHGKIIIFHYIYNKEDQKFKCLILANPSTADSLSIKPLAKPETIIKKLNLTNPIDIKIISSPTFCFAKISFSTPNALTSIKNLLNGARTFKKILGHTPLSTNYVTEISCSYQRRPIPMPLTKEQKLLYKKIARLRKYLHGQTIFYNEFQHCKKPIKCLILCNPKNINQPLIIKPLEQNKTQYCDKIKKKISFLFFSDPKFCFLKFYTGKEFYNTNTYIFLKSIQEYVKNNLHFDTSCKEKFPIQGYLRHIICPY